MLLGVLLPGLALAAATGARQAQPDLLDLAIAPAANAVPGKAPQRPVMGIARQGAAGCPVEAIVLIEAGA